MSFDSAAEPAEPAGPDTPFAAVPEALRSALERKGFAALTAVQTAVLDNLVAEGGRDLQISSQTGSGKTVALGFALAPALLVPDAERKGPLALVIAPTRELAMQIKDELQWLFADVKHVTLDCVTGGQSQQLERKRLRNRPVILVGTPGRLLDHATSGALVLGSVAQLVLDEADQMLDMGFRDELEAILAQVPGERRTHLVSATFPPAVRALTKRYQRDALHVEGTALGQANADIEHIAHLLNARDRYGALVNHLLLAGDARVLVFVRTREDTTRLADQLETDGFRAMPISGDLTQAQRTRTLAAFKRGTVTTLVATDVAARGIDVSDVQSVVHMDLPMDAAGYTHRSGRTGRAGQKGRSILLVSRSHEREARRMMQTAGIALQWRPVPTAREVLAARDERVFATLIAAVDAGTAGGRERALAARLLDGRNAEDVVAALLTQAGQGTTCEPFSPVVQKPHEAPVRPHREPHRVGPPAHRTAADYQRPERGDRPERQERGERPDRSVEEGFVGFKINWGSADGADPRRILAHVCRRGDVQSRAVGAIDIRRFESRFGIAAAVAQAFGRRVQRRDARDPHLVIVPVELSAGYQKRASRKPAGHAREREHHVDAE